MRFKRFSETVEVHLAMRQAVADVLCSRGMVVTEAELWELSLMGYDLIGESSVIDRMKEKLAAAQRTAKERGKSALSDAQKRILAIGGNVATVIRAIVSGLKSWMDQFLSEARRHYRDLVKKNSDEIRRKVSGGKKKLIVKEASQLRQVVSALLGWIRNGFSKQTAEAASKAAKVSEAALIRTVATWVDVDRILESDGKIPFLSTLAHRIAEFPPFNLLHKVEKTAEKVAAGALNKMSHYATELAGAPGPFEFVALAGVIGIASEVAFKGVAKNAIVSALPGLGVVASIISGVALGLAVVEAVEVLLKDEDEGEGDKKKEDDDDKGE